MPNDALILEADDVRDACHWYWRLKDPNGATLADHKVGLDPSDWQYRAFLDLYDYLERYVAPDQWEEEQRRLVPLVGEWIGQRVLGAVGEKILAWGTPVTVRVVLPPTPEAAAGLQYLPLELAYVGGRPLAVQDVSLVFEVQGEAPPVARLPVGERLRMLAVFSLPTDQGALNLRHERYRLKELVHSIAQRHGLAIDLRVLQYGVTRAALRDVLKERGGWDVIHFSGHGLAAGLVLEKPDGATDLVKSDELLELLRPGRSRLKWVTLSACLSAARTVDETLRWLGLEPKLVSKDEATAGRSERELAAVARALVRDLGCAVLAMRFPVGDEFAIKLGEKLYEGVLKDELPLTRAVQLALPGVGASPLAVATPALFGRRAADLILPVPKADLDAETGPPAAGMSGFDVDPEWFVGRVGVMAQASAALAPRSEWTGVLFHGMAGGGKTACALELAYHYKDLERFTGFVWYKAYGEWAGELSRFATAFETQLSDKHLNPLFPLAHMMAATEDQFDAYLPRLRQFLERRSVLLVLDNLETLLLPDGQWHEWRWGKLVATLLSHRGESRTVLTSRIRPVIPGLASQKLRELPIHSLSLDEAVLLARQLPNLKRLLEGKAAASGQEREQHRQLVHRMLHVVQGHPMLLKLADGQAGDPAALAEHLDRAEAAWADVAGAGQLGAFFREGASQVEADALLQALAGWTEAIAATMPEAPRTLFRFLCCLEEDDRRDWVVQPTWSALWQYLALPGEVPAVDTALAPLVAAGLVDVRPIGGGAAGDEERVYALHPGVAEAGRAGAGDAFQAAVDTELAALWGNGFFVGLERETSGGAWMVLRAGRSAVPYLMRQRHWVEVSTMIDMMLARDASPATSAAVLPLLRRLTEVTRGTERELINEGMLAKALLRNGRQQEAEAMLQAVLDQATARRNFRLAHAVAFTLVNLLRETGRAEQALDLVDRMKDYTRRADLGPWTQLDNEGARLHVLNELGRYDEVLAEVERLWWQMAALPESDDQKEAIKPWSVRERILDAGYSAARRSGRLEPALALAEEIVAFEKARGATALALAFTCYKAFFPLLHLGRYNEARALLEDCRETFKTAGDLEGMLLVFGAMADLEDTLGNPGQAVDQGKTALRFSYLTGHPRHCATSHFNLANYLKRGDGSLESALAHRLASIVIHLQTGGCGLPAPIQALSRDLTFFAPDPPPVPSSFAELCRIVEQVEGVRFAELFARLPTTRTATGDEALRRVLELAQAAAADSGPAENRSRRRSRPGRRRRPSGP